MANIDRWEIDADIDVYGTTLTMHTFVMQLPLIMTPELRHRALGYCGHGSRFARSHSVKSPLLEASEKTYCKPIVTDNADTTMSL